MLAEQAKGLLPARNAWPWEGAWKGQGRVGCLATGLPWAIYALRGAGSEEDIGWDRPILLVQFRFRIVCEKGGFNTGKMVSICRLT